MRTQRWEVKAYSWCLNAMAFVLGCFFIFLVYVALFKIAMWFGGVK